MGGFLEASWGVLEASCAVWRPSWASWSDLGAIRGSLGPSQVPFGAILAAPRLGPKIGRKSFVSCLFGPPIQYRKWSRGHQGCARFVRKCPRHPRPRLRQRSQGASHPGGGEVCLGLCRTSGAQKRHETKLFRPIFGCGWGGAKCHHKFRVPVFYQHWTTPGGVHGKRQEI